MGSSLTKAMDPCRDFLLEAALTRLAHHHAAGIVHRVRCGIRHLEIAFRPGADHVGDVGRIAAAAQEMVGAGQRHEALGVSRRGKDMARILDAHQFVGRRMKDEQRFAQIGNSIAQLLPGNVVEEGAANPEWATGERDFQLASGADLHDVILQQADDVGRIAGCADGHHRTRLRHLGSRRQHRRAAETVANENGRCPPHARKLVGRCDKIGDIGGKRRIGELALARAQAREVEAQDANAKRGQAFCNPPGGVHILAASEAMGEQGIGPRRGSRLVKERRETVSVSAGELKSLRRHANLKTAINLKTEIAGAERGLAPCQPYLNQFVPHCD